MAKADRKGSALPAHAAPETNEITEQELASRKAFLEFREADVEHLTAINHVARRYADDVIEAFYRHLLSFDEARAFFTDPQVLQRVKSLQKDYFLELTQGKYDVDYAQNRLRIGAVHERAALPVKSYLGMYNFYLRAVAMRLADAYQKQPQKG